MKPVSSVTDVEKCIQRFALAWQTPISNEEVKPSANDLLAAVEWTLGRIAFLERELRHASEKFGWLGEHHVQTDFARANCLKLMNHFWDAQAKDPNVIARCLKPIAHEGEHGA